MDAARILLALHAPGAGSDLPAELAARGLSVAATYNQADTWNAVRRGAPDAVLLVPVTGTSDAPELLSLVELASSPEGPALLVLTDRPAVLEAHAPHVDDFIAVAEDRDVVARRLRFAVAKRAALRRIRREMDELARASSTDFKTGLVNDRQFTERCRVECARAARDGRPLGVLVVDLDDFKAINDQHDHPFGDYVLRQVAAVLRAGLRPFDTAARMGGDEFAILLPGAAVDEARRIAERLRLGVGALALKQGGHEATASITIGAAAWDPRGEEPFEETLRGADRALLAAKRAGRNRVAVYAGPVPDDLELELEGDGEGEAGAEATSPSRASTSARTTPPADDTEGDDAPDGDEASAAAGDATETAGSPPPPRRRGLRRSRSK